jgi:peptide/nickel transport system substrate-binding protein
MLTTAWRSARTLGVAAFAVGCAAAAATTAEAQEEPQRGGTMSAIIQPEPPILMLGLNQQGPTQTVAGKIYEGLLTYDFNLDPLPSLAKSWEVSDDGLTYTFELQENVTWHDGEPFTAEDVIFTTMEFLPEVHPRARANFSRVESAEAPDDHTVVYTLTEPFPAFMLAFEVSSAPMIPKHIYEGTDFRQNEANNTPIGTGPFKFVEWQKGSFIRLERNENYWREGQPYLDAIIFRVLPDAASRALALETGEVQLSSWNDVELFDVQRLQATPHLKFETRGYEFFAPIAWIEINHRVEPLGDKRFRQAIMHALDREFIRDNIWFGLGRIPTGPINSVTPFYTPDVKEYDHDPEKAIALLDEMGLEPDGSGVRARITCDILPYGETWTRLAEYVKQALEEVGIAVELRSTDAGTWAQRVSNWDYEITFDFVYQYGDPALGVARTYISDNIRKGVLFSNTMGYENPEVDRLFAEAATTADEEERARLYAEVQKILVEDVPVAWLLEMEFPTFINQQFENVVTTAIGVNETFAEVYMRQ